MAVVYSHNKPCGEVFYVGIGQDEKRAYDKQKRSNYWKKIAVKYGYEVKIVKEDISYEEAREVEIFMIDFYGRRDLGKGTLCNMTDGGEGRLNPSEELRRRMGDSQRGKGRPDHHLRGRKQTQDHILKCVEARKDIKRSKEANKKASQAMKNNTYNMIKVICVDTLKIWDSVTLCQEELGIKHLMGMLNKNSKQRNKTSIEYLEDYEKGNITCKQNVKEKSKKVINVNTGEIYNSKKEACEKLNLPLTMHQILINDKVYTSKDNIVLRML